MSKASRRKGRKGESTAKSLLGDMDWTITADCTAGLDCPDLIATKDFTDTYAVEVKNTKAIDMNKFRKQAREQAKKVKLPYIIMAKIYGTKDWLIEIQDGAGSYRRIWTEK